jgi:hypothetical protein
LAQVVVTNEPSVVEPTVHGSEGVAAKLVGPGGWLQVVVIQSGAVPAEVAPQDATATDVLFAAGWVQMKME